MHFNKKIFILSLVFLISGCASKKPNLLMENGQLHRPSMNPGGDNFGDDPEFCKSYNKLQIKKEKECRKPRPHCELEPCNKQSQNTNEQIQIDGDCPFDADGLPKGATLIAVQNAKKSKQNDNWFDGNCIENAELSEKFGDVVSNRCEKIIEEKPLPEVILNNGKKIVSADCVMLDDSDIIEYEDMPKTSYKKKKYKAKKNACSDVKIQKPIKKGDRCSDFDPNKKKKSFKISFERK